MDGDTNSASRKTTKEEDVRVRELTDRMAEWLKVHTPAGHKDARSTEIYAELGEQQATQVLRLARKARPSGG